MPVTYRDFRDSAKGLFTSNDEMDRRNAISRSYYAAFHYAKRVEIECDIKDHRRIEGRASHVQLASKFQNITDQSHLSNEIMNDIHRLGVILNDGRQKRQIADYDLEAGISDMMLNLHQRNMDKFHDLADQVMEACKS